MIVRMLKPKTVLLLYRCMWLAEKMLQPTLRHGISSFDDWASRTGLWRDIRRLEELGMLTTSGGKGTVSLDRVIRLTEAGKTMAMGGIVPPDRWNRGWDGKWRLVMFDIPEIERRKRARLRETLHATRFGLLQRSVWISPDPIDDIKHAMRCASRDCGALSVFEGSSCLGESPAEIVSGCWDFARVDEAHSRWFAHAELLGRRTVLTRKTSDWAWAEQERQLWSECLELDPLLPRELWPEGYRGEQIWKRRVALLAKPGTL